MARRGFFRRIVDAFRGQTPEERAAERRQFSRGKLSSARAAEEYARREAFRREVQKRDRREAARARRDSDPFRKTWMEEKLSRPGRSYGNHRELIQSIPGFDDLDQDEQLEIWRDYMRYMVRGEGPYRRGDVRNPFWGSIGIRPRNFDWDEWRMAMFPGGKSPGGRK